MIRQLIRSLTPGRQAAATVMAGLLLAGCGQFPFVRSSNDGRPAATYPAAGSQTTSRPADPPVAVPVKPASVAAPAPAAPATAATTTAAAPAAPAAAGAPPAPTPMEFSAAVVRALDVLMSSAEKVPGVAPAPPRAVVIDPLVDGNTGAQTQASDSMGRKITGLIGTRYNRFTVKPFARASLDDNPLLLVGTLTAINAANNPQARNDLYRICLALIDVKAGKVIAKGVGRATEQTVDARPLPYYEDSPALVRDRVTDGYVRTCQGTQPGGAADSLYLERLPAAMMINDATVAYNAQRYPDAARFYRTAADLPGGDQVRVLTGLYLANWKMGRRADAAQAFNRLVGRSLDEKRLALKMLFRPNSTEFVADKDVRAQYAMWLQQLARRADDFDGCLNIVGHTSRSGNDTINDPLSSRRAQLVRDRLARESAPLGKRLRSSGVGSREAIVGTGTDDVRDAVDRRVEFRLAGCDA